MQKHTLRFVTKPIIITRQIQGIVKSLSAQPRFGKITFSQILKRDESSGRLLNTTPLNYRQIQKIERGQICPSKGFE